MKTKVLIVGAGAIGAFYGALLARQGVLVSLVCRSDFEQVKRYGYRINSAVFGEWTFKPHQLLTSATEYQDAADFVILCTKVLEGLDRNSLIADAVGPDTAIVFIQNGVEIEREIADAFPDHEVISGLAFICCNRLQPGKISHMAYGKLTLGNYPAGCSAKTRLLCELFNHSGIECIANENIITARWQKNVWNAPFNPLSVLSGGLLTLDILSQQEDFVRHIMQDVCNIAAASGHPLADDVIDFNIASTYKIPPYKTSMLLDYENTRAMETEAILGNAIRAGKRAGVTGPYLESVYAMMKLKERYLQHQSSLPVN